ncbi:MAG: hypothetical protein B7X41_02515 [Microbacterium sp. 14-71-5]|nr:MAG: hypothetical protein B7X41_02515 [Microbacterium sp. 14-71-5]
MALCTDALVSGTDTAAQADPIGSPTTSRGCSNIDLTIIDKGSTTTLTATVCAGISPSRVDPVAHRKIRFNVFTVGTDTVSTTVGGFIVASTGTPWSRYPNQWEPWVVLEDIEISGIVDHSAQTAASNSTGELYIYTQDPTNTSHFATVRRLRVSDLTVLKSPASSRSVYVVAPGATDPITIRGVDATGSTLVPIAPAAAPFVIERSRFASIDNYSTATVKVGQACKIGKINGGAPVAATEAAIASAGAVITQKEVTLTLTGASVSWTNAIPPGSLLLGVQGKINTAITGPTRWQLGISGDVARFADRSVVTAGYVFGPSSQAATEVSPKWYSVNTTITLTAYTTAFTGGEMRLVMTYITFPDIT